MWPFLYSKESIYSHYLAREMRPQGTRRGCYDISTPIRSGVVDWFALFGAVDEPLASCSVVQVEVNVYKRQLVCKFDIMDIIFLLILLPLYRALYHICLYQ